MPQWEQIPYHAVSQALCMAANTTLRPAGRNAAWSGTKPHTGCTIADVTMVGAGVQTGEPREEGRGVPAGPDL